MITTVIFDMDGLLIETESLQSKAYEQVLTRLGKIPKYEQNGLVQIVGIRGDDAWETIFAKHGIVGDIRALREEKRKNYMRLLMSNMIAMPGVLELLQFLSANQYMIALVSGTKKSQVENILTGLNIANYFNVVVGGDEVKKGKPDPEGFLMAAQKCKVLPADCMVLEDSEAGIIAAKKAGMYAVAIPNVYTKNHNFAHADNIFFSLLEVRRYLAEISVDEKSTV